VSNQAVLTVAVDFTMEILALLTIGFWEIVEYLTITKLPGIVNFTEVAILLSRQSMPAAVT
jgi:hypothetical protein